MRKKKFSKKLNLNKAIISKLESAKIKGGEIKPPYTYGGKICVSRNNNC